MPEKSRIIPYFRVSTSEQGDSGAGLAAQAAKVTAERKARDWHVVDTFTDVASGKSMKRRPELAKALGLLAAGEADLLVVAKLDRLSRSMLDFACMVGRAQVEGWGIAALDIGVDTSTPNGKLVAHMIMALAEWERELIGQRTKDALVAVKARGTKLGRPSTLDPATETLIRMLLKSGQSYRTVAAGLNDAGVPTSQGGTWHASTVRLIATRAEVTDAPALRNPEGHPTNGGHLGPQKEPNP